jgi:hypothetical protein
MYEQLAKESIGEKVVLTTEEFSVRHFLSQENKKKSSLTA